MNDGSLKSETVYRRQANVVVRKVAGELIVVPIKGHLASLQRIFMFNPVGEYIWSRLDGEASVAKIVSRLIDEFEVTAGQAEADAAQFISQLDDAGLVERVS